MTDARSEMLSRSDLDRFSFRFRDTDKQAENARKMRSNVRDA